MACKLFTQIFLKFIHLKNNVMLQTSFAETAAPATIIFFNEYTVHYYSQSSNPWEAAYINCFETNKKTTRQAGTIVFTYPEGTVPPGQENSLAGFLPTSIPPSQINHLELRDGENFFVIYYSLTRFDDVINQLRYAADRNRLDNAGDKLSMFVSADTAAHVWALGNNLHLPVGAQYKI